MNLSVWDLVQRSPIYDETDTNITYSERRLDRFLSIMLKLKLLETYTIDSIL